jgi:hypothetical protein
MRFQIQKSSPSKPFASPGAGQAPLWLHRRKSRIEDATSGNQLSSTLATIDARITNYAQAGSSLDIFSRSSPAAKRYFSL